MEARNRNRDFSLKLSVISRRMRMRFDEHIQLSGLTRANWTLFAVVARNPGATQKFIAHALQVTEVSAGRMIERLHREGYLRREASIDDKRAYRIFLTELAEPILTEISEVASEHEATVFQNISADEIDLMRSILDRIQENLDAMPCVSAEIVCNQK